MILKNNYRIKDLPASYKLHFLGNLGIKEDHITNETYITISYVTSNNINTLFSKLNGNGYLTLRELYNNLQSQL